MQSDAYCTDNVKFMKELPDKAFYLGNPDPPYGIKESSKNHKSRNTPVKQKNGTLMIPRQTDYGKKKWDEQPPSDEYFTQLFRVTQEQFIWGGNYFSQLCGTPFKTPRRSEYVQFIAEHPTGWVIWDKVNGGNDFNDCELSWTSFDRPTIIVYYMWNGMMQGRSIKEGKIMQGNKKLNEKRWHPTQKPLAIYQWIYQNYLLDGQSVFDPNMGSGGSKIVAYKMNIPYVGVEIDCDIFADSQLRFERETYSPLNFGKAFPPLHGAIATVPNR